jgi:hypothetical protein
MATIGEMFMDVIRKISNRGSREGSVKRTSLENSNTIPTPVPFDNTNDQIVNVKQVNKLLEVTENDDDSRSHRKNTNMDF